MATGDDAEKAPPDESPLSVESNSDAFAKRPEIYVGAAFLGGLAIAQVVKRLGQ